MISAQLQLQRIEELLLRTGGSIRSSELLVEPSSLDSIGTLDVSVDFAQGQRLHASITIEVSPGYPDWVYYSIQLLGGDGRSLFRYDNAPHHVSLPTFPHHKHVGPSETPVAHHLPTLHEIVAEITTLTAEESAGDS